MFYGSKFGRGCGCDRSSSCSEFSALVIHVRVCSSLVGRFVNLLPFCQFIRRTRMWFWCHSCHCERLVEVINLMSQPHDPARRNFHEYVEVRRTCHMSRPLRFWAVSWVRLLLHVDRINHTREHKLMRRWSRYGTRFIAGTRASYSTPHHAFLDHHSHFYLALHWPHDMIVWVDFMMTPSPSSSTPPYLLLI